MISLAFSFELVQSCFAELTERTVGQADSRCCHLDTPRAEPRLMQAGERTRETRCEICSNVLISAVWQYNLHTTLRLLFDSLPEVLIPPFQKSRDWQASRKIFKRNYWLSQNSKVHFGARTSPPLVPVLSPFNPLHILSLSLLGNLEEGLSIGDFERWMKGALGMECLSLKRLRGEGFGVGGSSFTGEPERYVKKGSGYGHLSP
jgi:hypothetical protein